MLVFANGQKIELNHDNSESMIRALDGIFKNLYENNEIVQEVVIDGRSYREGYNSLLVDHALTIREVEIRTVNGDVLVKDIAAELRNYLPKLLQAFDSISELFYGEMQQEDWGYFGQLAEGMQWVVQSAHILRVHSERFGASVADLNDLTQFSAEVETRMSQLDEAIQDKDYTAVGDMLKYEFPEVFQSLLDCMENGVQS